MCWVCYYGIILFCVSILFINSQNKTTIMDTKKLLTGTLVGTVVAFICGYLLFGMALSSYMAENASHVAEPNMAFLIAGHVVYAGLITYIFLQWAGIKTAATGAKAGAIIALLGALGCFLAVV